MKKLILETTAPFQGLPELVAYDEGLFEKEGLIVEWADREQGVEKKVDVTITAPSRSTRSPATASCSSRARRTCTTPANGATTAASTRPRKAAASSAGARSWPIPPWWWRRIRRSTRRNSSPTRPSACRSISARTTSRCTCCRGSSARDEIKLCSAPNGSRYRLKALMDGEVDAVTLDRAAHHARREEGLPDRSARRSSTAPRSRPTGSMPRPMRPSTAR